MRRRSRDLAGALVAAAAVAVGGRAARCGTAAPVEARCFAVVNQLPAGPYVPVWAVMQFGSLGGAMLTALVVGATGRPALGRRMAAVVVAAWLGSKAVKPFVRRGRPTLVVDAARVLGREQRGLGYPSGHAAVAAALASAASPHVAHRARRVLWVAGLGVGLSRMYVGAHLPLDVAGGVALGIATERCARVVTEIVGG